jgi:hypothetical protein
VRRDHTAIFSKRRKIGSLCEHVDNLLNSDPRQLTLANLVSRLVACGCPLDVIIFFAFVCSCVRSRVVRGHTVMAPKSKKQKLDSKYFTGIETIKYEGPDSNNPMCGGHLNPRRFHLVER